MKSSISSSAAAAILAFVAAASAVPAAGNLPQFSKRSETSELANCINSASPELCFTTVETISDWDNSVNVVNLFLNIAVSLDPVNAISSANFALNAALLEPGFLATLSATPGLSQTGQNAASVLGQVFPAVPANLMQIVNSEISVTQGVDNINAARCSFAGDGAILQNIGTLWVEAAAAVGADVPGFPLGPLFCAKTPDNVGDAYN